MKHKHVHAESPNSAPTSPPATPYVHHLPGTKFCECGAILSVDVTRRDLVPLLKLTEELSKAMDRLSQIRSLKPAKLFQSEVIAERSVRKAEEAVARELARFGRRGPYKPFDEDWLPYVMEVDVNDALSMVWAAVCPPPPKARSRRAKSVEATSLSKRAANINTALAVLREAVAPALAEEIQESTTGHAAETSVYVRLDQVAAIVQRSKRTLEKALKKGILPKPDIRGGAGKPHEWNWESIRPALEHAFRRRLPRRFPSARIHDARADRN